MKKINLILFLIAINIVSVVAQEDELRRNAICEDRFNCIPVQSFDIALAKRLMNEHSERVYSVSQQDINSWMDEHEVTNNRHLVELGISREIEILKNECSLCISVMFDEIEERMRLRSDISKHLHDYANLILKPLLEEGDVSEVLHPFLNTTHSITESVENKHWITYCVLSISMFGTDHLPILEKLIRTDFLNYVFFKASTNLLIKKD